MQWIDLANDQPLTEAELKARHPNTSFPDPLVEFEGYAPVVPDEVPSFNAETHRLQAQEPREEADGEWRQGWQVKPLTADEITAARKERTPASVTRAQGKLVLIQAGLWDAAQAFVEGITDPAQKAYAEVALNDTQEWRRDSPFLAAAAAALSLNDEQLDALFVTAQGLTL